MKIATATPLLERDEAVPFTLDLEALQPQQFVDLMDRHKALLFQAGGRTTNGSAAIGHHGTDNASTNGISNGSGVLTTEDFGQFVVDLQLEYYPYVGGAAPRTIIPVSAGKDIVFTANESPPDQPIPFHHELAQTPNPPRYIFFYCDVAPETGGQTPIIDSTAVYRFAKEHHSEFIEKLRLHGARYIRTLPPQDDPNSPIGRSYLNAYCVQSREELDEKLAKVPGCEWEWLEDGCVRVTTEAVPAIRLITTSNRNYVFQETFANSVVAAYLGWQDSRNDRHEALRFGNNERMPEDVLESIAAFMDRERVLYTWKKGDIMALNNQLVMHSRNPFVGKRRVFASIWGPSLEHIRTAPPPNGVALCEIPKSFYEPLEPADPLVFGFWKVPKEICADVCYNAIAAGYRRLDCACDYGNEQQVGQGIARAIKDGLCLRQDLFVTSKLWNTYHHPDHVPLALSQTLKDLQLSYLDEYLIHFPISMEYVPIDQKYPPEWTNLEGKMVLVKNDMGATWSAMETLVDQGLVKSIGVCNFSTQLLRQVFSTCRIRPTTLQIETHPHNTQEKLIRFAHEAGLRVTAFSVLGASSYLELNMATPTDLLTENPVIVELAKAKNKSPAQILLRWAIQRNTLPLSKTSTPSRLIENRNVFDFYLTVPEMQRINALNANRRYNDPGAFCEPGMGTFCPIYE